MRGDERAVVLGATGHIGQAVVRELLAHGHAVTAATRRRRVPALEGLGVRIATGDPDDAACMDRWIAGHALVVDAAAPHPLSLFVPRSPEERDPVSYAERRIEELLGAVRRHGSRLAFVSSFTTLPRPAPGRGASADPVATWRRACYPYFRVKRVMEERVLAAARAGLPAAVLNPFACLGPWGPEDPQASFVAWVMSGRLPAVVRGTINVIDVRDVAVGVVAAEAAEHYGVPIPLAGHNVAVPELARQIAREAGVAPPALPVGPTVASIAAFWTEFAWATVGRPAPSIVQAVPLIADAWPAEAGAVQRALGLVPRPLAETLRDAVNWHRLHATPPRS